MDINKERERGSFFPFSRKLTSEYGRNGGMRNDHLETITIILDSGKNHQWTLKSMVEFGGVKKHLHGFQVSPRKIHTNLNG